MQKRLVWVFSMALLLVFGKLQSQTVANWTLNNTLAGVGTPHSSAGSLSLGSGVSSGSFNGGVEYFGQDGWPTGALNTSTYVQFTISPTAGHELHLSSVTLRIRRSNTGSPAGSGPTSWAIRSSIDGYSSNLGAGSMTHAYANYVVPLSSFTGLSSTVSFRVYGYNTTVSTGGNNRFVIDNISILGITALLPVQFTHINASHSLDGFQIVAGLQQVEAGTIITLEKSIDGVNFTSVASQTENYNRPTAEYSFLDPTGSRAFYRIFVRDNNNLIKRSKIVFIENKIANNSVLKIKSISGSQMVSSLSVSTSGNYDFRILSSDGRMVYHKEYPLPAGTSIMEMAVPRLHPGIYILQVVGQQTNLTSRFVKVN